MQLSHAFDSIEFELKLIHLTSKRQSPWHMSEVVKHISEIKLEMCPLDTDAPAIANLHK